MTEKSHKEKLREYYLKNKDRIKARKEAKKQEEKESLSETAYEEMLEKKRAYQRAATKKYLAKHKEKVYAKAREKRRAMGIPPRPEPSQDPKNIKEREKYYRNRDRYRARAARYYAKNKKKIIRKELKRKVNMVAEDYTPPKFNRDPIIDKKCEELSFFVRQRGLKYSDPVVYALSSYLAAMRHPHFFNADVELMKAQEKYARGEKLVLEHFETISGLRKEIPYLDSVNN